MAISVESMSGGEIRSLLAEIDSVQRKRSKRVAKVRAKIDAILKREGLSVEDVYASNGKRRGRPPGATVKTKRVARKRAAKYQNPQNPEQTWSGHGKRPTWFKEALEAGTAAENLLIGGGASKPARKAAKPARGRKAAAARRAPATAKPAKTARRAPRGKRGAKGAKADAAAAKHS